MTNESNTRIEFQYLRTIETWEKFCILHNELYKITENEYLILLEGGIEELEQLTKSKEQIIHEINQLELQRNDIIDEINSSLSEDEKKIIKASELIKFFQKLEEKKNLNSLLNLNDLLINIIEKLQEQNKKNQVFLNKAILSVKELKESFQGKKVYTTYGSDGLTKANNR